MLPPADLAPYETRFASKDADERRAAVIAAAATHGAAAEPLVARAVADDAPFVREAGVTSAGEFRMTGLAARLLADFPKETHPAVRRSLVVALGKLRVAAAVPILADIATGGGSLSREASFALGRVRDDEALRRLRAIERSAGDPERAKLAAFLASEDFVRQEKALGERWTEGL